MLTALFNKKPRNNIFDIHRNNWRNIKKQIRKALEITPFDYDKKWKPKKGYKDGWIYITVVKDIPDNNNVEYTWNFRDKSKRTIYSVQSINKEVSQVLAELGISTY